MPAPRVQRRASPSRSGCSVSRCRAKLDPETLHGPVVDPTNRTDVVSNQGEVDDLLASLGF